MLTERALQIFDKLIECNTMPVTSKKLALYLGVSERSVKNYIKEVLDYCNKNNMELVSKPGKGFVANFTKDEIQMIEELHKDNKTVLTQKNRLSYIMYILLSGWDSYTLSLFSEELNVSKKVISDDLDVLSKDIKKYNMAINRVAGHGISISSDEFSIRRALKEYCVFPIGNREVVKSDDYRLSPEDESVCINNFGNKNFQIALDLVKTVEKEFVISYTDYTFKMLVSYLCIGILRINAGNTITENIKARDIIYCENIVALVAEKCRESYGITLSEYEKDYVDILFAGAQIQGESGAEKENIIYQNNYDDISDRMLAYLSEILDKDFKDNELLRRSLREFLPASFVRTKYGILIINPFLTDVKEMYSGIFATSFAITGFYEKYCGMTPTEQEISFLALYIGGAIVRNTTNVKAVLIGTSGVAAANIVARKIENTVEEVKIVAILSSEEEEELDNYEFDILLSMHPGRVYDGKMVEISPIISEKDIKNIKSACYDVATGSRVEANRQELAKLITAECIRIVNTKMSKESVLKEACDRLYEQGYVAENFYDDVMHREHIGPTAIGNGIAIPHGTTANVCNPVVYVIKMKDKIDWGTEWVDLIFLLALNFDNVVTTKAFFSDFSRIIESHDKMEAIRQAATTEEVEHLVRNRLNWIDI